MEKKTTAAKPVVKTTATEASKDTVKEAAVKSAPAKESVKETAAETKAAAVAKEVEKKVAETKETVKDTAKKATEKVEAATKTVVKKAAAKKAAPKKEELKPEVFIQFQGQEAVVADVIEKAKKQFEAEGHRASSIKSIQVYLKPEEYAAYYVINQKHAGRVDLFSEKLFGTVPLETILFMFFFVFGYQFLDSVIWV